MMEIHEEDLGLELFLEEFPKQCEVAIKDAAKKAGREGVENLKENSPKRYGNYAKSWSLRDKSSLAGGVEYVVHNRKRWMLVHLLEDGHALIINGKYIKYVPPVDGLTKLRTSIGDIYVKYVKENLSEIE